MLTYILFIVGFVILITGANFLVNGASSIAKRLKVSSLLIGLTVVSFGTSAPELIINLFASSTGNSELAIGNILGSNISNILLILGITSIICPIAIKSRVIRREIPLSLLAALLLGVLANDAIFSQNPSVISRNDSIILLSFFTLFFFYTLFISKVKNEKKTKQVSGFKSILFIALGLIGLGFGGKWIVEGAVQIADVLGLSQSFIGLTILALGTSLPELATSAVAACKKNAGIAIGNIIGSNIFNILWIIGLSSLVKPLPFLPQSNIDLGMVILSSLALLAFMFTGQKKLLERRQGLLFILIYILYIISLIVRE